MLHAGYGFTGYGLGSNVIGICARLSTTCAVDRVLLIAHVMQGSSLSWWAHTHIIMQQALVVLD